VFLLSQGKLEQRLDPFYYRLYFLESKENLHSSIYPIVKLFTVCDRITDGTHYTPTYTETGVLFLSVKNVRENRFKLKDVKYISPEEHQAFTKRCKPEASDVLLTKVGTIGLAAVVPDSLPEFSIFVSVALLKLKKDKVYPHYISAYLNSRFTRTQAQRAVKGIGTPDWHLENIRQIEIPLPSLEMQKQIADCLQQAYTARDEKESRSARFVSEH
jgi:restriction endonuclease S subunit